MYIKVLFCQTVSIKYEKIDIYLNPHLILFLVTDRLRGGRLTLMRRDFKQLQD